MNTISDLSVLEKEYPLLVAVNRAAHSEFVMSRNRFDDIYIQQDI